MVSSISALRSILLSAVRLPFHTERFIQPPPSIFTKEQSVACVLTLLIMIDTDIGRRIYHCHLALNWTFNYCKALHSTFLLLFCTAGVVTLSVEDFAERYKVNDPTESCDEEVVEVKPNATCDNKVRVYHIQSTDFKEITQKALLCLILTLFIY